MAGPNEKAKALKIILIVTGVLFIVGGIVSFFPPDMLRDSVVATFCPEAQTVWPVPIMPEEAGMEGVPLEHRGGTVPLLDYVIRIMGAFCLWLGLIFLLVSRDLVKYRVIIAACGLGLLISGVVCFAAGMATVSPSGQIPTWWYILDAFFCIALGIALLVLNSAKATETEETSSAPPLA